MALRKTPLCSAGIQPSQWCPYSTPRCPPISPPLPTHPATQPFSLVEALSYHPQILPGLVSQKRLSVWVEAEAGGRGRGGGGGVGEGSRGGMPYISTRSICHTGNIRPAGGKISADLTPSPFSLKRGTTRKRRGVASCEFIACDCIIPPPTPHPLSTPRRHLARFYLNCPCDAQGCYYWLLNRKQLANHVTTL